MGIDDGKWKLSSGCPFMRLDIYNPGALNRSFIVRPQCPYNFCSIYVQILFNFCSISIPFSISFCSISVQIPFNWIEIVWKLNKIEKSRWFDPKTGLYLVFHICQRTRFTSWIETHHWLTSCRANLTLGLILLNFHLKMIQMCFRKRNSKLQH